MIAPKHFFMVKFQLINIHVSKPFLQSGKGFDLRNRTPGQPTAQTIVELSGHFSAFFHKSGINMPQFSAPIYSLPCVMQKETCKCQIVLIAC